MKHNSLGKSNILASHLSLGGLFVAEGNGALENGIHTINKAYELGINYIDTAPSYGNSESALGEIFKVTGRPKTLSTKVGGNPATFEAQNPDIIKASIENSLNTLQTDYLDIVMIHEPDRPGHYDWWSNMHKVEGPVLDVLLKYKEEGIIKAIGLGGTGVTEMSHLVQTGKFDIILTAFNYSLLYREAEELIIQRAKELDMGVIVGSPIQQGAFAKVYDTVYDDESYWLHPTRRLQFKELYDLCKDIKISPPELAIRFVASNLSIDCILMGVGNIDELVQNYHAFEKGPLPLDVIDRINQIAARLPCRPYEEPSGMGFRLAKPELYKGPGELSY